MAGLTKIERIDRIRIKNSYHELMKRHKMVLVEGVGGVMVPFNKKLLLIDLVKELSIPTIIVSGNSLGTINHSLLTVEALRSRGIKILGMIMNSVEEEDEVIKKDNIRIIREIGKIDIFGSIPRVKSIKDVYSKFLPVGRKVFRRIMEA